MEQYNHGKVKMLNVQQLKEVSVGKKEILNKICQLKTETANKSIWKLLWNPLHFPKVQLVVIASAIAIQDKSLTFMFMKVVYGKNDAQ